MSTLNSTNDSFVFNIPSQFVPPELEKKYLPIINMRQNNFARVIDYINHTIKDVTLPSVTFPTVSQKVAYGKEYTFRGAAAPNDTFGKEINITFQLVDSHITWFIINHCLQYHYSNPDKIFFDEMVVSLIDENRREMFKIYYQKIVFKSFSDNRLSNADKSLDEKTVTLGIIFNEIDIEIIPKESYEAGDGELIEAYSEIIEKGINGDFPKPIPHIPTPIPVAIDKKPPAPTNGIVNNITHTFTFTPLEQAKYSPNDYEYRVGKKAYKPLPYSTKLLDNGDFELYVGNIYIPANMLKIRLRAYGGLPASYDITNNIDFLSTLYDLDVADDIEPLVSDII